MSKVLFSVNEYDKDGDISEEGIYLHFGETRVNVAKDIQGFRDFIKTLNNMSSEIQENY